MGLIERFAKAARGWTKALAGAALLVAGTPGLAEAPARAAARAQPAAAPRPAIWLLEDADTKIYLFGTHHMFQRGFAWRSARLDAIIRDADELVMEVADLNMVDEGTVGRWLFMGKSVPILSRVSAAHRPRLQALIEASGTPIEAWDMMHSWAAALMVMGIQSIGTSEDRRAQVAALDRTSFTGAERELDVEFRRAGKPISGLETPEQQMAMFRTLGLSLQRAFLERVIDIVPEAEPDTPGPIGDRNWASGNVEALVEDMGALTPELHDLLLTRRNRAWTEWLALRLERPGTVLFAVGAGHLAGRDSVQSMLEARGLSARRID
ncbi:MAG TPA: TraB/GumN family protein [Allosphingosinicella sp.]|nr:TraB/GumN family protein [Allosphingosinicella sp.]